MKGQLLKNENNKWCVNHGGILMPLHPEFKLDSKIHGENSEIDFIIVDEFRHPFLFKNIAWGEGNPFAWLTEGTQDELTVIKNLERKIPNDMELGRAVRKLLNNIID